MTAQGIFAEAARVVARAERLDPAAVLAPRGRRARAARRMAAYLAVIAGDLPGRHVARAAGMTHQAVRKGLARIEDAREAGQLDRRLEQLQADLMRRLA